jgi:hypothetical protein
MSGLSERSRRDRSITLHRGGDLGRVWSNHADSFCQAAECKGRPGSTDKSVAPALDPRQNHHTYAVGALIRD